jgi:4-alpha-glucanotransferase
VSRGTSGPADEIRALRDLARDLGIQPGYTNVAQRRVAAPAETLLAAVRALGVEIDHPGQAGRAARAQRLADWGRLVEPVVVAPGGALSSIRIRVPAASSPARGGLVRLRITLEGRAAADVASAPRSDEAPSVVGSMDLGGRRLLELVVPVREVLPIGYHRLDVSAGGRHGSTLVISSPGRVAGGPSRPSWGVFLPLYALQSERSWGVGDLTDLEALVEWTAGQGGAAAATLPLLAAFLGDRPYDHSPYSPASKLFWNELYLDLTRVPELERSPEARSLLDSRSLLDEIAALRSEPLVDYRRTMAAKRRVLEALSRTFFADPGQRGEDFEAFERSGAPAQDYAAFRANGERRMEPWRAWPDAERAGTIRSDGGDEAAFRYHRYVQWLMAEQVEVVGRRARELGEGLYFDAPVGVNADGYDVWRERASFVDGVSAGCPPDLFFTRGQDWGFPPLHPRRIREDGYRYPIAWIRHLCRHAGFLRIDHVMGLHRLFWVPHGSDPRVGVYVRYRPEEWYAILAVESHRSGTALVGEDLGTVPGYVRPALRRHGLFRSHVLQMEMAEHPDGPFDLPPPDAVAAHNTHDMPPFAGYWAGDDLHVRMRYGWLSPEDLPAERTRRARQRAALLEALRGRGRLPARGSPRERTVFRASLLDFAASPSRMLLVNMEDLWAERRPQNVPGTSTEQRANWRRRARYTLEEIRALPSVRRALRAVDEARRSVGDRPPTGSRPRPG